MAFHPFGVDHLATLGMICALGILIAWSCHRLRDSGRAWLGWALGTLLVAYVLVTYIALGVTSAFSPDWALPLELCHWVLIACVISLFHPNQFTSEIAYFWGFGGTLQAVLTPDLGRGLPSWDFILFFWGHGVTLLAIAYLIAGRGFRPRRGSVMRMFLALNFYGLVAGLIDVIFGWNYGYLRQKPARPSLLDYLGPWPWYLGSIELIALAMFFILTVPWLAFDRFSRCLLNPH